MNKLVKALITGYYWTKMIHKYNQGLYGDALIYYKKSEKSENTISPKTALFKVLLYYKLGLDEKFLDARDEYLLKCEEYSKYSRSDSDYMDNFLNIMLEKVLGKKLNNYVSVNLDCVSSDIKDLFNMSDIRRDWD